MSDIIPEPFQVWRTREGTQFMLVKPMGDCWWAVVIDPHPIRRCEVPCSEFEDMAYLYTVCF
jgi:hypothetical protein